YRCARVCRPAKFAGVPYAEFVADGTGWRNATLADCLPSSGRCGLEDVTEAAGYGWRFFRDTARSRTRRALSPFFAVLCGAVCAGFRLSFFPRPRAAPHAPRALSVLRRTLWSRARRRPAPFRVPAVPEPAPPQAPGHGAGRVSVPAVSVLMSVHNGAPWVRDAVASVLAQTAGDLALIAIADGYTAD